MNIKQVDPKALQDSPFTRGSRATLNYFKNDRSLAGVKAVGKGLGAAGRGVGRYTSMGWGKTGAALTKKAMATSTGRIAAKGARSGLNVTRRIASNNIAKGIGSTVAKSGMLGGIALGAVAMIGVGIMKGAANASREIVAERAVQDQRYARNITMMSRLGYTSGTNRLQRYGHTVGLSQALAANRHGRGAY